jgi:hypothetical protein
MPCLKLALSRALFAACSILTACGGEDVPAPLAEASYAAPGPLMQAGENCMSCHITGGTAASKPWTAAGTVYRTASADFREGVEGATIVLVDAAAKEVRLTSNAVGNFYTAEPLAFPYTARVEFDGRTATMPIMLDSFGACAGCHSRIGRAGALGRIRVP